MRLIVLGRKCAPALIAVATGMSLAGCASDSVKIASVKEGAAKVFSAPPCAVKSTTRQGQRWVDETTEGGVAALGWKRPTKSCAADPRPAVKTEPTAAPAKKAPWWKTWRRKQT